MPAPTSPGQRPRRQACPHEYASDCLSCRPDPAGARHRPGFSQQTGSNSGTWPGFC